MMPSLPFLSLFHLCSVLLLLASPCAPVSPPAHVPSLKDEKESIAMVKRCDLQLGSHFTKTEKTRICGIESNFTVSPLCASEVRKEFRNTPFDDIVTICSSAPQSLDHLTCLRAMTPTERLVDGVQLCKFPTASHLSVVCYRELIMSDKSLKNKRINNNNNNGNQEERDSVMLFCSNIKHLRQVKCFQTSSMYGYGKNDVSTAIVPSLCSQITDDEFMEECLIGLNSRIRWNNKKTVQNDRGKSMLHRDAFEFCTQVHSWSEVKCYNHSLDSVSGETDPDQLSSYLIKLISSKHNQDKDPSGDENRRLKLCKGTTSDTGPIECLKEFHKQLRGKNTDKVGVSLCSQATTNSSVSCYMEIASVPLKDELRLRICQKALDNGPIDCFKSIRKVFNTKQVVDEIIVATCSMSTSHSSSGTSSCFIGAPKYLSSEEKMILCRQSTDTEPAQCVHRIESSSKLLMREPQNDDEHRAKANLIAMCAGGNDHRSMSPVKTAQCFLSVYRSTGTHDGIKLCSQISMDSTPDVFFGYVPTCLQTLNIGITGNVRGFEDWTFLHAALLCAPVPAASSTLAMDISRIKEAVACAHAAMKTLRISKDQAVDICKGDKYGAENKLMCIQTAHRRQTAGAGAKYIDLEMLLSLCSTSTDTHHHKRPNQNNYISAKESSYITGECISQITSGYINDIPRLHLSWNAETMRNFCYEASTQFASRVELTSRLNCILSISQSIVTNHDVTYCLGAPRYIKSVKVLALRAENNQITVTAGHWFSVDIMIYDNFGTSMNDLNGQFITLGINEQNSQGAVLWGRLINASINGTVSFSRLVITQPGDVRLFISVALDGEKKRVGTYSLLVDVDENKKNSSTCLFIFNEGMESVQFHNQYYVPYSQYFWIFLSCMDLFDEWFVHWTVFFDRIVLEYKPGIESIWTGRSLPSLDMSHYERLGLDETTLPLAHKATAKLVKKAYYQMSLKWHPDRWASMPIYNLAVQEIFELISESYKILASQGVEDDVLER